MKPDVRPNLDPQGLWRRIPFAPHQLTQGVTPARDLFVLAHLGVAHIDRASWTLDIAGLVERPRRLGFADLGRYPKRTLEAFHQCAGNPTTPYEPERRIANVVWSGVALADVLADVGVAPEATFVWSFGSDHGTFDGADVPYYLKDLPLTRLAEGDVMLATEVNGEPLSAEHGSPVRLVVPGFYGTNSVKWLYRIELAATRATGLFTTRFYNDPGPDEHSPPRPVWNVAPESVIVDPAPGATLRPGPYPVSGWAWADTGIERVHLSVDDGRSVVEAEVQPRRGRSWQAFRGLVSLTVSGTLTANAFDRLGAGQPIDGARNAIHRVPFEVLDVER